MVISLLVNFVVISSNNLITETFHSASINCLCFSFLTNFLHIQFFNIRKNTFLSITNAYRCRFLIFRSFEKSLRRLSFLINSRSYNMTMINVNICGITTITWEIIKIRKILINIDFRSYSIKVEISRPNR